MTVSNEKVKLDEVLKFLFSTSKKVLVNLLNGIFEENFSTDEVELSASNNEFIIETFDTLKGDVFFELLNNEATYHLEFQTKNDSTMTKTLYDPEVEKRGIEKGIEKKAIEDAIGFFRLGVSEEIVSKGTGLPIEKVKELKDKINN
ncbi:hypothetical protein JW813_16465 [Clostridium botulinum]|uniref:hypothetical protein n=1 Tax=Clostridium botulinum TaxID=1491 RepID=UPI002246213D|nr:hypothetical protein [Clostridium botulinum]UZP03283.1 hypothetical protein JW813_16465 [Clostridium botulinum]UZP06641.1 hypothetical protein JYA71_16735 [Clostridium botulinum]UZP10022.1 hypothetical protein JYA74_16460 [Clostridium botulinum]